eukprot:scaffold15537_cov170-Amphora_coffeaeformis.AAC.5
MIIHPRSGCQGPIEIRQTIVKGKNFQYRSARSQKGYAGQLSPVRCDQNIRVTQDSHLSGKTSVFKVYETYALRRDGIGECLAKGLGMHDSA